MAWDENVCANSPAPEFDIPEDKSAKEILLEILGYEETEITVISGGKEETITVLKKKDESNTAKVCESKICGSYVGCAKDALVCTATVCNDVAS